MKSTHYLVDAYIELLKIQDHGIRIKLQSTYCYLRDTIAELMNQPAQFVQEKYEEIALIERLDIHKENSKDFMRFILTENTVNFGA